MATNAWAADLERLKRDLLQRIERAATDAQNASARGNQNNDLTRRLDTLERRVQTTIDQTNRTFTSSHASDAQITTRLDQLERRVAELARAAERAR